jgi:hypothetical protein
VPSWRPCLRGSRTARGTGLHRRPVREPAAPPFARHGRGWSECPAGASRRLPWESIHAAGARTGTAWYAAPAVVFAARPPAPVPRCARRSGHLLPARRGWRGSVDTLRTGRLRGTPCPTSCRTGRLLRSWLSPATHSAGFEPNQAGLVGSRQSLGSSHFVRSPRNRGPSLHQRYPASSLLRPHPPSAAADSTPHEVVVDQLPVNHHHGLPLLHDRSVPMRAATTTPVDAAPALHARFGAADGLPRLYGGSASTMTFRGLLSVHSRCGPHGLLASYEAFSSSASAHSLPPGPLLVLPAGARVGRVGLSPTDQPCLCKAHIRTIWKDRCARYR